MPNRMIEAASLRHAALGPAPIPPAWVRSGKPVARAVTLSTSSDGTAFTAVWDCTQGSFDWRFHGDETVHILEGEVVVTEPGAPPRRLQVGDVALFHAGTTVHWEVPRYVRKLAFCRNRMPRSVLAAYRLLARLQAGLGRLLGRRPQTGLSTPI
jgi:uncharacterized protein